MEKQTARQRNRKWVVVTLCILVFLLLLAGVGMFFADYFDIEIDMTSNQFYHLSSASHEALNSLSQPVTITVLNSKEDLLREDRGSVPSVYLAHLVELLEHYEATFPNIQVFYAPYEENSPFDGKYPQFSLSPNDILIQSGGQGNRVAFSDLWEIRTIENQPQVVSSQAERVITNCILDTVNTNRPKVVFLKGYGQPPIPMFEEALRMRNYEIEEVDISTSQIPSSASIVVLLAPEWDLETDDLDKISSFLSSSQTESKTLFYVASYTQPQPDFLPKLSSFLSDWGIVVEDSVVFENQSNLQLSFPSLYESHVLFSEGAIPPSIEEDPPLPTIYYAKPMHLKRAKNNRIVSPLWETSSFSGKFPSEQTGHWQVSDKDYRGPIPVLALSQEEKGENTSNVLVLTSYHSLDDSVATGKSSNMEYLINLFHDLTHGEHDFYIGNTVFPQDPFFLLPYQAEMIGFLVVIVLPSLLFLGGVVLWLRRRRVR